MKVFRKKKYVYWAIFKRNDDFLSVCRRVKKGEISFYDWLKKENERAQKELPGASIFNMGKIED